MARCNELEAIVEYAENGMAAKIDSADVGANGRIRQRAAEAQVAVFGVQFDQMSKKERALALLEFLNWRGERARNIEVAAGPWFDYEIGVHAVIMNAALQNARVGVGHRPTLILATPPTSPDRARRSRCAGA